MDYRYLGAIVNGSFYCVAVVAAGLATWHPWATYLAIAALGVTYLSYLAQLHVATLRFSNLVVAISILLGIASGLALFI